MPARLNPITPASADAILVGDPRRAFLLAQELTTSPLMSHLARGLWGYVGGTPSGGAVTIQSTGIGGPSAVAVITDLAKEGVTRFVRLGTCLALDPGLLPGAVIQAESVVALDGASRALVPGTDELDPDPGLNELLRGLGASGRISSHDLVARADPDHPVGDADVDDILARDLQTAACLAVARRNSMRAAALLIVVEAADGRRLEEPDLESRFIELGREVIGRLATNA